MKKGIGLVIALMLTLMLSTVNAQSVPSTGLMILRPQMRNIQVYYFSTDGYPAFCMVYQKIMSWQDYEYVMNFTINPNGVFYINMTNLSPIYRELGFSCSSPTVNIQMNSVYTMGGLIIQQSILPVQDCPTCTNQGYILPSDCTSNGYCICPTPTTTTTTFLVTTTTNPFTTTTLSCLSNGQDCNHNSDCCNHCCHYGDHCTSDTQHCSN